MINRKKGIVLVAALAAAVSLSACQKTGDGGKDGGTQTEYATGEGGMWENISGEDSGAGGGSTGENAGAEGGIGEDMPQTDGQSVSGDEDAGNDLDYIEPDPADDNWYMKGSIYKDSEGRRLEVFFDDEGMLEFAVDGLSMYYSSVNRVEFENNWRIYSCDDGIMIIYYPGEPAHIEISDGDYAGLYEEDAAQGDA
ncbi:MAG: hypothetical protein K2J60_04995 [Acetatifactor sp.]|nr:hypothetical protein [Acetatifactor sp.]